MSNLTRPPEISNDHSECFDQMDKRTKHAFTKGALLKCPICGLKRKFSKRAKFLRDGY